MKHNHNMQDVAITPRQATGLIEALANDDEFREHLIANPSAAFRRFGVDYPASQSIEASHLPSKEVLQHTLQEMKAGKSWSAVINQSGAQTEAAGVHYIAFVAFFAFMA